VNRLNSLCYPLQEDSSGSDYHLGTTGNLIQFRAYNKPYNWVTTMPDYDIDKTLQKLAAGTPTEQDQAYEVIKYTRDVRFVDGLIDLLRDADYPLLRACIMLLGIIGDPDAVPFLLDILRNRKDETLQADVIEALGHIGDPETVPVLIDLLNKWVDKVLREQVIIALGRSGDQRAEKALLPLSGDENVYVRRKIATALGGFSSEKCVHALLIMLEDNDRAVRAKAAASLGKIGDPQAIPALDEAVGDHEWTVRFSAVSALAQFDDEAIIDPLCYALQDPAHRVRIAAAEKLGELGTPLAYEPLLRARQTFQNREFDKALAKIDGEYIRDADGDVSLLITLLSIHDKPEVIAATLEEIGTPEALEAVAAWRASKSGE
jgi:HEAT repeat protein